MLFKYFYFLKTICYGFDRLNNKLFINNFMDLIGGFIMSMHSSLKGAAKIKTKRNVLKRFERVDSLKKDGRWSEGDRAYGLPKTKPSE